MAANHDELISKIESMTVVELADLVKKLEEKFGIGTAYVISIESRGIAGVTRG